MTHVGIKISSGTAVRAEGGIAGEGKLVDVPKFHSWGKCTMPLMNMYSQIGCPMLPLACVLTYITPQDANSRIHDTPKCGFT